MDDKEIMSVLNTYASELELDISDLIVQNGILKNLIDILMERDPDFHETFC